MSNKARITLIDYGVGNLGSVRNAFNYLGVEVGLESNPKLFKNYDKLILPGVGAYGDAINTIRNNGFDEAIIEFGRSGKYILGICLGMQLLFEKSYEFGEHKGLGLIKGEISAFSGNLRVPHIGWNACKINGEKVRENAMLKGLDEEFFLYFVHSFCAKISPHIAESNIIESQVLAYCDYGERFAAIVAKDNIIGIQPHPEKSHNIGLKILENFIHL